jgi:acetolactate synthase I/II/III large subunit
MGDLFGGQVLGQILEEEEVRYLFGIQGAHNYSIISGAMEHGIELIHMRHEQAAAYAGDAYARITKRPAVCMASAGPGVTNMISGIAQAHLAHIPMVALLGQHSVIHDQRGALQEIYAADILRTITKWSKRIVDWKTIAYDTKKAFREALRYPPGPVALEFPMDKINISGDVSKQAPFTPQWLSGPISSPAGNPALVKKAVTLLLEAQSPVIVAGDGIYWSGASAELTELVEMLQIPVNTRRLARGAVPEDHPLALSAGFRKQFLKNADLILIIGHRLGYLERYGQWGKKAKYIQVNEAPEEIEISRATELEITGCPKVVLQQLIDLSKQMIKNPRDSTSVREWVRLAREDWESKLVKEESASRTASPLHPAVLAREIVDFLDSSATLVYDAFTATQYLTDRIKAGFAGQILDSGEFGAVGHGVGMGIGAQLARPGKEVLVLMGDGGMGVGGMDIETARKYNLPVVYLVCNNSMWTSGLQNTFFGDTLGKSSFGMIPGIRYDKMFEVIDCHAEHVDSVEQIRPALERAFSSGKTSVINAVMEEKVRHRIFRQPLAPIILSSMHHLDKGKIPEEGRRLIEERQKKLGKDYF